MQETKKSEGSAFCADLDSGLDVPVARGDGRATTSHGSDFDLLVGPSPIAMTVGTLSSPASITVTGRGGFAGDLSITVSGLAPGAYMLSWIDTDSIW